MTSTGPNNGPGGGDDPPRPDVALTADSFADLARRHPAEVARYLEPVLRGLHADADALPPETALAYQVFAADVAVDPATADRVARLVARLDADDFHDRDAAARPCGRWGRSPPWPSPGSTPPSSAPSSEPARPPSSAGSGPCPTPTPPAWPTTPTS